MSRHAVNTTVTPPPDELFGYVDFLAQGKGGGLPEEGPAHIDPLAEAQAFRIEVQGYQDLQTAKLDPYAASLYADGIPANKPRRLSWSNWLAEDATDEQLIDFQRRQEAELAIQRADPHIVERFDFYRGGYVHRLREGIDQGWVSPYAVNKLHRLETARLEIGDVRSTHLAWKTAEYRGPMNTVVIGQGINADPHARQGEVVANIYHSLPHELSHIFGRWLPRWASEGFAEQMNMAVREGDPLVFNPTARRDAHNQYAAAERSLLHNLFYDSPAGPAAGPEAAESFLRAATSRNNESREWRHFNALLDRMWNQTGMFDRVSTQIKAEEVAVGAEPEHADWVSFQIEREAAIRVRNAIGAESEAARRGHQKPQHIGAAAVGARLR